MVCGTLLLLQLLSATPAGAAEPVAPPSAKPDSTYGRIDGDIGLVLGVGLAVGPDAPRGAVDFRVRYLDTVGVFFDYEDGSMFGHGAEPVRVLAGGLELRPLFLGRWLTGHEIGNARLDLALDSLGFELGGVFAQPQIRVCSAATRPTGWPRARAPHPRPCERSLDWAARRHSL